ncbi:hypothetical protein AGMMS50267_17110 [Spirochaetia bacterium]|nr:hypothetical protein AGMMS50267_17110 [Spirochaetia bacterium]
MVSAMVPGTGSIPMPFIIVPEGATNLFSVTAMELLDLMPDPIQGKLVGVHGGHL